MLTASLLTSRQAEGSQKGSKTPAFPGKVDGVESTGCREEQPQARLRIISLRFREPMPEVSLTPLCLAPFL